MDYKELKKNFDSIFADNEQAKDFAENRKKYKDNKYLPKYHFSSPGGYLNDPCGLCKVNDVWHLFYQFVPEKPSMLCWGHAASTDMMHWLDYPAAVVPTYDDFCGSGGALVDGEDVYVCYQGPEKGQTEGAISIAKGSGEILENWDKPFGSPVIHHKKAFDPYMWKENGKYYLLSAGGGSLPHPDGLSNLDYRKFYLYESTDLEHWTFLHNFIENDKFSLFGDDGACPYFLPLGDQHIILHFSHKSGGKWILGDYDRERMKFTTTDAGSFNNHSWISGGVHAPSAFADGNGGIIAIFNINFGICDGPVNQIMSLPLHITLGADGKPKFEPFGDYKTLRKKHQSEKDIVLKANEETVLPNCKGKSFEMEITVDTKDKTQATGAGCFIASNMLSLFEISVLRSKDAREHTDIRFYRNRSKMAWEEFINSGVWGDCCESVVEVDTSHSTLENAAIHPTESASYYLSPNEPIKLHIFVDKSVVEVFSGGKLVAVRSYPSLEESDGISLVARGTDAVISYDFYEMGD